MLTVVEDRGIDERGYRICLCRCDCSVEKIVRVSQLGVVKSCGCLRRSCRVIHIGQEYGWLTAEKCVGKRGKNRHYFFLFKCRCGNRKELDGYRVRLGLVDSCGCLRSANARAMARARYVPGLGALTSQFWKFKSRACARGIEFAVTKEQFRAVTSEPCFYCGLPPEPRARHYSGNGTGRSVCFASGLDRVDSRKGYVIDNVVPCCDACNRAKCAMTIEQFESWIKRVAAHNGWLK